MDAAENERVQELIRSIERLRERQEQTEQRLAALERLIAGKREERPPAARPVAPPDPPLRPAPPVSTPLPPWDVAPSEAPQREPQSQRFETSMGLTWINRVGVITLVIGVGFFFKWAVEAGWINEWMRVLLGVGTGLAALFGADRLWHRGHRTYAHGVSGAGIGILYLSFYSAYGLYHLVPQAPAFLLMLATTAAAGALALRYDSMAIAMLGILGGFITPAVLEVVRGEPSFLLGYLLLLAGGACWLARRRHWIQLEVLAFSGIGVLYTAVATTHHHRRITMTLFAIAYYGVFAISGQAGIVYAAQLLTGIAFVGIWWAGLFQYAALTLALACTGLVIVERRAWPAAGLVSWLAYFLATAFWFPEARRELFDGFLFLTLGFLVFLAWLVYRVMTTARPLRTQDLMLIPANAAYYFAQTYALSHNRHDLLMALFAVALAAGHIAFAQRLRETDRRTATLAAGTAAAFLVLAGPLAFSGYRVTMVWALEAAAFAWIGLRAGDNRLVYAAYAVFALAAGRLLFLDSWIYSDAQSYTAILNARFITFAIATAALWAAARWARPATHGLILYLAGHCALPWALILDTLGWAQRRASPENYTSFASTSVSILIGCYAVLLVAAGTTARSTVNRLLGLILIGFIVLKLYLYDVWLLGLAYRVAAFVILGALLLIMSYFYSRFRSSVETWWRDRGTETSS